MLAFINLSRLKNVHTQNSSKVGAQNLASKSSCCKSKNALPNQTSAQDPGSKSGCCGSKNALPARNNAADFNNKLSDVSKDPGKSCKCSKPDCRCSSKPDCANVKCKTEPNDEGCSCKGGCGDGCCCFPLDLTAPKDAKSKCEYSAVHILIVTS